MKPVNHMQDSRPHSSDNKLPKRLVLLALPQGAEAFEAAAFIDVFGWHNVIGAGTCRLITCSEEELVRLSFGQSICAQKLLAEARAADYDALALPGGFGCFGYYADACREPYYCLIQAFAAQQKPIAAICTGAVVVANAGVLAGRRATVYSREPQWPAQITARGAIFENSPLVNDGNIITSQNPASAIPVALELLELLTNAAERAYIQREMGF
ncbi:MAG: DJ-1/PfpI family protein [Clostridiales bacterium]|nr:DJ-1/PfpI family protein [Clostridiales bacterium]